MGIVKGKLPGPRKLLLYADHGIGKSSFAAGAPNPVFLDIEGGTHDLDVARWDEPLNSWPSFLMALDFFYRQPHDGITLVIDSVDWLERLIFNDIAGKAGVEAVSDVDYGRGLPRAIPMWEKVINKLHVIHRERRMMIVLLAHAKVEHVKNLEGQEYDRFAPGLYSNKNNEGACKIIQEWVDEVFFMRKKKFVREQDAGFNRKQGIAISTEEREILTSESGWASAKNRLNMPTLIPLPQQNAWSVYMQYIIANRPTKPAIVEQLPPQGMAEITPVQAVQPSGDLAGVVVDGTSRSQKTVEGIQEMEALFSAK